MAVSQHELTVVTEELPGSQLGLTIEVPQPEVEAAYEKVLDRLARRAKIEGFRPGKAPRALVEARVGAEALREEVIDALVPEVLGQVFEERRIEYIGRPRVDAVELERGKPGRLSATVSVMPEVKLPDLKAIHVDRHATDVTDEMVERRLEALREALAELEPVEREVREGDVVIADIDVDVEGVPVPAQRREAAELEVREGALIPELRAVLPGNRVGEKAEAIVTLPEEYSEAQFAGKSAHFVVTIRGVKEKHLPPLDDELAQKLSEGKYATVDELRAGTRADLEEQALRMDELAFEQAVLREVVEKSEVEVPAALVDHEVEHELEDLERRLGRQGVRLDRYLAYQGLSAEEWAQQARPDAESRLRVELVLDQVARAEGIQPAEAEVDEFIEREAARDEQLKTQAELLKRTASTRRYFSDRLQRQRTLAHLVGLVGAEDGAPEPGQPTPGEIA